MESRQNSGDAISVKGKNRERIVMGEIRFEKIFRRSVVRREITFLEAFSPPRGSIRVGKARKDSGLHLLPGIASARFSEYSQ